MTDWLNECDLEVRNVIDVGNVTDWMTVIWKSGIWLTLGKWLTDWMTVTWKSRIWRLCSGWLWPGSRNLIDVCLVTDWLNDCGLEVRSLIDGRQVIIATKFVPFLGTSQHLRVSEDIKAVAAWGQTLDFQLAPTVSVTYYVIPVSNFPIYFMLQCWETLQLTWNSLHKCRSLIVIKPA